MKKKFLIIFLNIIGLLLIILASDFVIYEKYKSNFSKTHASNYFAYKFKYVLKEDQPYLLNIKDYFTGNDNLYKGRKPDGLEYRENEPITIFGCSFAHGQYLEKNQTISYKLAKNTKRPVYNRAIPGSSFQHMYYQTTQQDFYNDVPKSNDVIYIMMNDHYRRAMVYFFDILDLHFIIHYSLKDNKFVMDNYDNQFKNLIKSLYTSKYINQMYVKSFIKNSKNADKLTELALTYFIETRNNLEKNWNNKINFTVVLYDIWTIEHKELLKKKLLENNFNVIDTNDFISPQELKSETYKMNDNNHPKEIAWDLLAPKIQKELSL